MTDHLISIIAVAIGMAGLLGTMIAAWINIKTKLAAMEVKILEIEKDIRRTDADIKEHKDDTKAYMEKVDNKLGNIWNGINEIKIALATKEDKK